MTAKTPFNTPPSWCSNAIATTVGWVNPDTGEIMVASRYLDNPVPYDRASFGKKTPAPAAVPNLNSFELVMVPESGPQPLAVQVTVQTSTPKPTKVHLHWGDGSEDSMLGPDVETVTHVYPNIGKCTLTGTATFADGQTLIVKKLVKILKPKKTKDE